MRPLFPGLRIIMAHAGHQSRKLARQLLHQDGWKLVIVKRGQHVFKIIGLTWWWRSFVRSSLNYYTQCDADIVIGTGDVFFL